MGFTDLLVRKEGGIGVITFNQPERLNAAGLETMVELNTALNEMEGDPAVRVVVLTGAGRAFCAGGNYKGGSGTPAEIATKPELRNPAPWAFKMRAMAKSVTLKLQNLRCPTIAMVNGPAVGAGFCVALACDMRTGSENTRFCVMWTRRGLLPELGSTWLLPRIVGLGMANELIFTGRWVEAEEAKGLGILNKLVPAAKLEEETMALADQIAKGPPLALAFDKINIYKGLEVGFDTALDMISPANSCVWVSQDHLRNARGEPGSPRGQVTAPVFEGN